MVTPPPQPLDEAYRVELLEESSTVSKDDVLALWEREGAVVGDEARRRVHEVIVVGTHLPTGELAGVSTTYLQRNAQLRMDFWYYRTFVGADHRMSNLAANLTQDGCDILRERWASGADRRGHGIVVEVENEGLKRYFPQAIWGQDVIFIGESRIGAHVRVQYFPGALAPLPE